MPLRCVQASFEEEEGEKMKRALLMARTNNLGDDIQAWPAWQFWERDVDAVLERDTLDWWYPPRFSVKPGQKVAIILNGWLTHNPGKWLPPNNLLPLLISLHIAPEVAPKFFRPEVIEYLSQFEIGARDLSTLDLLRSYGLKAYFSGCLTLTISYWLGRVVPSEAFRPLIVDMDKEALRYVPSEIRNAAVYTQEISRTASIVVAALSKIVRAKWTKTLKSIFPQPHLDSLYFSLFHRIPNLFPDMRKSPFSRLLLAEERLRLLSSASLILTSRLHIALPAASLGVPVILVHGKLYEDPRFTGLSDVVNGYTLEEFRDISQSLVYDKLINPRSNKIRKLKEDLLARLNTYRLNVASHIEP